MLNVRTYLLKTVALVGLFFLFLDLANAQSLWTELPNMPKRIANNAVTQATVGDTTYVYSFGGIDSTKTLSGISQTSMRYNTVTEVWSYIEDLPDTLGKIASAASTVDNIIYITGGYHVFPASPFELSSDKVHRYDPETNEYLSDGAPIPIPIDDHVQAVWRDSLIYVISGWSDTGNVPFVQIYNPFSDEWMEGSPTPSAPAYTAFGASGFIVNDTIFFNGGASGGFFNPNGNLRRGIINPDNPMEIDWDLGEQNPGEKGYRMAATAVGDKLFWIGGSGVTYNYNGIAYNGSGGVDPLYRILSYDSGNGTWFASEDEPHGVMDLRGIAQVSLDEFIICGGMIDEQEVSNKTFLIRLDLASGIEESRKSEFEIYPNPVFGGSFLTISFRDKYQEGIRIDVLNNIGQSVHTIALSTTDANKIEIDTSSLPDGLYYAQVFKRGQLLGNRKFIVIR